MKLSAASAPAIGGRANGAGSGEATAAGGRNRSVVAARESPAGAGGNISHAADGSVVADALAADSAQAGVRSFPDISKFHYNHSVVTFGDGPYVDVTNQAFLQFCCNSTGRLLAPAASAAAETGTAAEPGCVDAAAARSAGLAMTEPMDAAVERAGAGLSSAASLCAAVDSCI